MKINKPKFWDLKKTTYLSRLLQPFTLPLIINNYFLSLSKKDRNKMIKTICLGNIYVGGTGKTPLTIKLNKILQELNFKTATIKKFYKEQNDEQMLLNNNTRLYCKKKRSEALNAAIKDGIEIAIFDDGLQDRSLKYDLSFVCFNNENWIGNGELIPSGPLRESLKSILKYDAIFLNGNEEDNLDIKKSIKKISNNIKIFDTYYKSTNIDKFDRNDKYLIFSGIGNPSTFKMTLLKNKIKIIKEINFPDHYQYKKVDIEKIKHIAHNFNLKIITTEKDFVKIPKKYSDGINFLEIDLVIKNQEELISFIKLKL
jgi:tetraacyldisaccharide 4'-kinase